MEDGNQAIELAQKITVNLVEEAGDVEKALRITSMIMSILIGSSVPPDSYDEMVDNLARAIKNVLAGSTPPDKFRQ